MIYRYARLLEVDHTHSSLKSNDYKLSDTLEAPVVSRVIEGALISKFTPNEVKEFVYANAAQNT